MAVIEKLRLVNFPITKSQVNGYTKELSSINTDVCDANKNMPKWFEDRRFIFFCIGTTMLLNSTCDSLQAPFFPSEAIKKGVPPSIIGIIFGAFDLCKSISSPFWGKCISKLGVRLCYRSGVICTSSCVILFGFLDKGPDGTVFAVMCVILRSLEGVFASIAVNVNLSTVAIKFSDNVASMSGLMSAASSLGFMLGPPIGGALYMIGGYGLPFYINGSMYMVVGILSSFIIPEHKDKDQRHGNSSYYQLFTHPLTVVSMLSTLFGALRIAGLAATLEIHLTKFELSAFETGCMFLISPLLYTLTVPFVGYLVDKSDFIHPYFIVGSIGAASGFLVLGPAPFLPFIPFELWIQGIALGLNGLSMCCAFSIGLYGMLKAARDVGLPDDGTTQIMVSGLYVFNISMGLFLGPVIGGIMVDILQFAWTMCIFAGLSLIPGTVAVVHILYIKINGEDKASVETKCGSVLKLK